MEKQKNKKTSATIAYTLDLNLVPPVYEGRVQTTNDHLNFRLLVLEVYGARR